MLFGEKMPDKDDPQYKERYEREVQAGHKFAKATRIDQAAAKVQGFANAQVPRGGVSLADVDPSTMASRLFDGLHIIGELLDVDGPCGGYNLHFAFAGALAAAKAIAG